MSIVRAEFRSGWKDHADIPVRKRWAPKPFETESRSLGDERPGVQVVFPVSRSPGAREARPVELLSVAWKYILEA